MFNRVIATLLVLIMFMMGAMGAYSYILTQRFDDLGQKLIISQQEQAAGIQSVSEDLAAFRDETLDGFNSLQEDFARNEANIAALEVAIDENLDTINSVRNSLRGESTKISNLSTELSRLTLDASSVYRGAVSAVVRITDGENVVGSGFLIDNDGHVMTANHVIEAINDIEVVLADGSIYSAKVTGSSKLSDIAILTLDEAPTVTPLKLADSARVKIGQPVVAIGNPLGVTETITYGIVSQLNEFIEVGEDSETQRVANLIQFDAPVNFGNSGGPIFNARGEVIGMVVARVKAELGDGIYYAISSNKLTRVSADLIELGSFDYPWLGVKVVDLTPQMARDMGLDDINGVLIESVVSGSPAATYGLKKNDIIISMNGQTVRTIAELKSFLGEFGTPGQDITITVLRDGTSLDISVTLGSQLSQ